MLQTQCSAGDGRTTKYIPFKVRVCNDKLRDEAVERAKRKVERHSGQDERSCSTRKDRKYSTDKRPGRNTASG